MIRGLFSGIALVTQIFLFVGVSVAQGPDKSEINPIPSALKEIVKITDTGLQPSVVTLDRHDASVFFVNNTQDSLTTISIDFGQSKMHCASPNLKMAANGKIESVKPFGPKDFAITCFPDAGTYSVLVSGLKNFPKGALGKVLVKP